MQKPRSGGRREAGGKDIRIKAFTLRSFLTVRNFATSITNVKDVATVDALRICIFDQ